MNSVFFTIYDDLRARIGVEQGVGNYGTAVYDRLSNDWIIIESVAEGTVPVTLPTILPSGRAYHSRHLILPHADELPVSQGEGSCTRRTIR